MKKMFLPLVLSFAFVSSSVAYGQTAATSALYMQRHSARQQFNQEKQQTLADLKTEILQKNDDFKKQVQAVQQQAQANIETERQQLQASLQKIKDVKKQQTVQQISDQIAQLNTQTAQHLTDVLGQLANVLSRIASRTDTAAANGINVSAAHTAITTAQAAIASARTAVTAQAGKTYTITVTTTAKLGANVGVARQALRNDLKKVQDIVKAAQTAVRKAATTLAQIPRVDEATTTPTTTTTTTTATSSAQ